MLSPDTHALTYTAHTHYHIIHGTAHAVGDIPKYFRCYSGFDKRTSQMYTQSLIHIHPLEERHCYGSLNLHDAGTITDVNHDTQQAPGTNVLCRFSTQSHPWRLGCHGIFQCLTSPHFSLARQSVYIHIHTRSYVSAAMSSHYCMAATFRSGEYIHRCPSLVACLI
jgi:hypothetical protein